MNGRTSARIAARVTNPEESLQARAGKPSRFADDSCSTPLRQDSRGRYVTAHRLAVMERTLSDRDREVLTTLTRVRVATARQLYQLHFEGVTRRQARAALASLAGRRLITRLPRVVGGVRAGSTGYVYTLDLAGIRLMHPEHARPQRPWSVGHAFLDHSLAITDLYVRLVEAHRTGRLTLADFVTEPGCWRRFSGSGGGPITLKPDAAVRLLVGRFEDRWFIEVDRGTESRTALARKCDLYRQYWQTGREQSRANGIFPKVLWLVPDERRQAALADVIGRQPAYAWPLFAASLNTEAVERLLRGAGE